MTDTNQLSQPGTFAVSLTEILRNCALLAQAVEAEVAALLSGRADEMTRDGCASGSVRCRSVGFIEACQPTTPQASLGATLGER